MNMLALRNNLPTFFDSFDRLFYETEERGYPPWNAWFDDDSCFIEMAVSGFSKEDLKIEFDGKTLIVRGQIKDSPENQNRKYVHRGLAKRQFARKFELRGSFILNSANLRQGLLVIELKDDTKKMSIEIQEE